MKTVQIRRQSGSARNGWVRNEKTGKFLNYSRIIHQVNSGNLTVEFELPPGEYTVHENWYGKIKRNIITVE